MGLKPFNGKSSIRKRTAPKPYYHVEDGWPHHSSESPYLCICLQACCQDDKLGCICKTCACTTPGIDHGSQLNHVQSSRNV